MFLTKADLAVYATKADLRELELRFDAKLANIKADLLKWMFAAIAVQTATILGAVAGIVKGLGH